MHLLQGLLVVIVRIVIEIVVVVVVVVTIRITLMRVTIEIRSPSEARLFSDLELGGLGLKGSPKTHNP